MYGTEVIAIRMHSFLVEYVITILKHPPYSSYLVAADFFIFPCLNGFLKGTYFAHVPTIQQHVKSVLQSVSNETFSESFQQLYEHCQRCFVVHEHYFGVGLKVVDLYFLFSLCSSIIH